MNKDKKWDLAVIVPGVLIGIQLLVLHCFHIYNVLNSDMAGELVLAKQLSNTGGILSENWYYTTELRVLNTQIISSLLFKITDNWQVVRVMTSFSLYVICALSFRFLGRSIQADNKNIWVCQLLLLIPWSGTSLRILQVGNFYYPHIILMFLALGSLFFSLKKSWYCCFWYFLCFFMGVGGLRYLLVFQIPLVCAGFVLRIIEIRRVGNENNSLNIIDQISLLKFKEIIKYNIFLVRIINGLVIAGIGYIYCDKILRKKYIFDSFNNLNYQNLGESGESIFIPAGKVLMGIPEILGYTQNVRLFSIHGIINLFALIFVILVFSMIVIKTKKIFTQSTTEPNFGDFMLLWFDFSFLANLYIFIFTENYTSRYWIPVLIILIPIFSLVHNRSKEKRMFSIFCFAGIICYGTITGSATLKDAIDNNQNEERFAVNHYLSEKNTGNVGYSTFWNANITTEMTNGKVKMIPFKDVTDLSIFHYLTPRDTYESERNKAENLFILLSRQELESTDKLNPIFDFGTIGYQDENFIIYEFSKKYLEDVMR